LNIKPPSNTAQASRLSPSSSHSVRDRRDACPTALVPIQPVA
jgi:hypothetical protein